MSFSRSFARYLHQLSLCLLTRSTMLSTLQQFVYMIPSQEQTIISLRARMHFPNLKLLFTRFRELIPYKRNLLDQGSIVLFSVPQTRYREWYPPHSCPVILSFFIKLVCYPQLLLVHAGWNIQAQGYSRTY